MKTNILTDFLYFISVFGMAVIIGVLSVLLIIFIDNFQIVKKNILNKFNN